MVLAFLLPPATLPRVLHHFHNTDIRGLRGYQVASPSCSLNIWPSMPRKPIPSAPSLAGSMPMFHGRLVFLQDVDCVLGEGHCTAHVAAAQVTDFCLRWDRGLWLSPHHLAPIRGLGCPAALPAPGPTPCRTASWPGPGRFWGAGPSPRGLLVGTGAGIPPLLPQPSGLPLRGLQPPHSSDKKRYLLILTQCVGGRRVHLNPFKGPALTGPSRTPFI